MRNLFYKIKKNWVSFFIGALIVLLLVSAVLRAVSPPIVKVPQSPNYTQGNLYNKTTTFQNISYTGPAFQAPAQMTVSKMTTTVNIDSFLSKLQSDFQLTKLPDSSNIWTGANYSLSRSDVINYYTLTNNEVASPSAAVVNKDTAIETANTIIQKYAPNVHLAVVADKVVYYTADLEPVKTTADKASWVFLPMTYTVDNVPVFYQSQREYPFEFVITAEQSLQKFSFYPFFIELSPLSKQNTISVAQAVVNMNTGHASLIGMDSADPAVSDITQITSADLDAVSLEYRADSQGFYVYPFYRFSGNAVNKDGSPLSVEIITPAIQTVAQ